VRFDRVHFKEYGESSLNFEVVYFVKNPDYNLYMDIQQAINLEIFRRFLSEGIEFAYPTRTMFIQSGAGQSPDSRTIKSQE
jgi:small-conductance mechanosensitive channel